MSVTTARTTLNASSRAVDPRSPSGAPPPWATSSRPPPPPPSAAAAFFTSAPAARPRSRARSLTATTTDGRSADVKGERADPVGAGPVGDLVRDEGHALDVRRPGGQVAAAAEQLGRAQPLQFPLGVTDP